MANAFAEYNYYEYGNVFKVKNYRFNVGVVRDFIYRRFNEGASFLLNTEELVSIFHFPLKNMETPNIAWLSARQAPAPTNLPTKALCSAKMFIAAWKRN